MLFRGFWLLVILGIGCTTSARIDNTGPDMKGTGIIARANNRFALEIFTQIKKHHKDENIFFSPLSIVTALTMVYEGARGQTAKELEQVLHIPSEPESRRQNFAHLINELNRKDKKYTLGIANALWAQKDYRFLKKYFQVIEKYYQGRAINVDFVKETEETRKKINNWVEEKTKGKIKNLIPEGTLKPLTRLVLTNAIYFKGNWAQQFDKQLTHSEEFQTLSRDTVKVPMMSFTGDKAKFNYAEIEGIQILELPYEGDDLSMLILLPEPGKVAALEESLSFDKLTRWQGLLRKQQVDVYLPRFKLKTKYFLAKILIEMGMPSVFGVKPTDFSGMDGTKNLSISKVIHQGFVEVNEEGTEAAGATGIVMELAMKKKIPIFRADHPFLFLIQHKPSGTILFFGRVGNPDSQ